MIKLISKADILDKGFISTACITNMTIGIKTKLLYMPRICQVNVFNKNKSQSSSSSQSIGINIKNLKLICQKNSFMELKLDFDKDIKDITGLPYDMVLENKYIKGSPKRAGDYLVIITFNDDSSYKFNIYVPNLKRIY